MAPPTLSPPVALVMVLSLVLGVINMIKQSGSVFGLSTIPSTWLPYFTLAATFLGGVVSYFTGLSPLVINGASVFYAIMAGVTALLAGAAPAMAVHAHFVAPQMAVQAKKLARSAAATTLGVFMPLIAVATLTACKAVNSVINEVDAECEQLSTQPDENGYVKLACEVLTATGDVIQFFEVKLPQEKAAAYLKAHPLKPGHKSPKSLAVTQ